MQEGLEVVLRKGRSIAALAVLVAMISAPGAAAERKLSIGKASKEAMRIAKKDCRKDRDCERADVADCRRQAKRRVSCVASNLGINADGEYRCDRLVIVRLRANGKLKSAAGKPSCYEP